MPDEPDVTGAYTPTPPGGVPGERFAPGALLAGRFRVVAPLGRGGMGEVYRADDLTLGQPVALKFLPAHIAHDPDRLARFRKEVAAARRVSHPNVCRVYDIVEHEGQSFLTMEFIDGEDLSSVLKRLGRVPEEKGVEIARQLCSALAAVHDQGMLHRDLKPANVMLDGRGKVRLTDFGLAAAAEDLSASEVRSGTPLYQSPEQLVGREVTVRSDLYALGLVLYELFTGKRAFADARRDTPPSKPGSHVSGLNPAVEAVILRCLEPDPANRPRSAFEVLAGLPGGDPLAAAVAAGETPSPQLVADAGEVGLIKPWVGLALVGAVVLGLVASVLVERQSILARRTPISVPPDEMNRKARAILADLGYTDPPGDAVGLYWTHGEWLRKAAERDPDWRMHLTADDPAITFLYRESPGRLNALDVGGTHSPLSVTADNPPPTQPGMAGVRLTTSGRMVELYTVPGPDTPARRDPLPADVWRHLFAAAKLDFDRFRPDPSIHVPPVGCDERLAWVEADPAAGVPPVRVEAARCGDRPVFFRVVDDRSPRAAAMSGLEPVQSAFFLGVIGLGVLLAVRNIRRGRADVRTVSRMILVLAVVTVVGYGIGGRRNGTNVMGQSIVLAGGLALRTAYAALCYLSVEPLLRRRWPWRLTGWRRLFDGRLRDPLVGRDVLIGAAAGACAVAAQFALELDAPVVAAMSVSRGTVGTPQDALEGSVYRAFFGMLFTMFFVYLLFLAVRRERVAWVMFAVLYIGLMVGSSLGQPSDMVASQVASHAVYTIGLLIVLARFGLLAAGSFEATTLCVQLASVPADWHAPTALVVTGVLIAVCAACFYTATGGRRLFKNGFFGDD